MTADTLPTLEHSLAQFSKNIAPLVDAKTFSRSQQAATEFAEGIAPALHDALITHAQATTPQSWLFELWREAQLKNSDSLPLSSNIAMKIEWKAVQSGLKGVAFFVNAIARVHQSYFADTLASELEALDLSYVPERWQVLAGASRQANLPNDQYFFATDHEKNKHIIVLYNGRAWKLDILDPKGGLATPAQIENALYLIVNSERSEPDIAFASPSVLPTAQALEVRQQMFAHDDNCKIWRYLDSALFVLSLDNEHHGDDEEALHDAVFGDGDGLWAYKPFTYRCHLQDDRYYVNFEHTWLDSHSVDQLLYLAQNFYDRQDYARRNALADDLNSQALEWHLESNTRSLIKEPLVDYQRRSEAYSIKFCDVFLSREESDLLQRYGDDAIIQLLLQYAQQLTYHTIRSTYEAIGSRPDHNGNSDCIRPVSAVSKELVEDMVKDHQDIPLFERYIAEHRQKHRDGNNGLGMDRHFLGLKAMAEAQVLDVPFFSDNGYRCLLDSFIVTTSYSHRHMAGHIAFAPTGNVGLGIDYAVRRNNINFILTYRRSELTNIPIFTRALQSGIRQMLHLFTERSMYAFFDS